MSRVGMLTSLAVVFAAGCALTSRSQPYQVKWYTPEVLHAEAPPPRSPGPALRLGAVRSGPELERRIAWSNGAYQMAFYDDRRWTERPARFVTSALRRVLFETRGLQSTDQPTAPLLEVEVVSFEEVRSPRGHYGRVALQIRLSNAPAPLDTTVIRDEPVQGAQFDDVVAAISRALDGAANEIAARVQNALCAVPESDGGVAPGCPSGALPAPSSGAAALDDLRREDERPQPDR